MNWKLDQNEATLNKGVGSVTVDVSNPATTTPTTITVPVAVR